MACSLNYSQAAALFRKLLSFLGNLAEKEGRVSYVTWRSYFCVENM